MGWVLDGYLCFWDKSLELEVGTFLRDEPEASTQVLVVKPMLFSKCSIS